MLRGRPLFFALASMLVACGSDGAGGGGGPAADTTVRMDFAAADFYAAPFPSDGRRGALAAFPNPSGNDLVKRVLALTASTGFGVSSPIFISLTGSVDPSGLPELADSVTPNSSVTLLGIDPTSPDYLVRYPVSARLLADAGPYGAPNLLVLLPLQGVPLRPKARYAAVVMDSLHDAVGRSLGASPSMRALRAGERPAGLDDAAWATYAAARDALSAAKVDLAHVAGLTAFTTGSPLDAMGAVVAAMNAAPPAPSAPFAPDEVFPTYCVYSTTVAMPEYQRGTPPYASDGGDWVFDANGAPVLQRSEPSRFVVTIPRAPMPSAGYPAVVLSRTGAGGDRPLVDRGVEAATGGPALTPGTGPALYFAAAGFAGASIDGPLGGLRNPTGKPGDEDFTIFNVGNPAALRDNVRQSAAELAVTAHVLESVTIDVSSCPGAVAPGNTARFDVGTLALMGHSMGATIAPLAAAFEPRYRALLLSGSGGSWIENVIYKQKPLAPKGIASVLIGIAGGSYELNEHDPVLGLFQWACEAADPPLYSRRITLEPEDGPPRHVLMMQGIVDHYIMPPIANAESLSLGLDLAGDELDTKAPEIAQLAPLGPLLPLVGRTQISLPASLNLQSGANHVTAVVTQHPEDGVEDGHEVVFQTDGPKHEYVCFLSSLAKGAPSVPAAGKALDPCP